VDKSQEQELRAWALSLSGSGEPDRRAMAKAIVMLLGQIE
jgi:hypothetical protein